mgnify:FL=1
MGFWSLQRLRQRGLTYPAVFMPQLRRLPGFLTRSRLYVPRSPRGFVSLHNAHGILPFSACPSRGFISRYRKISPRAVTSFLASSLRRKKPKRSPGFRVLLPHGAVRPGLPKQAKTPTRSWGSAPLAFSPPWPAAEAEPSCASPGGPHEFDRQAALQGISSRGIGLALSSLPTRMGFSTFPRL